MLLLSCGIVGLSIKKKILSGTIIPFHTSEAPLDDYYCPGKVLSTVPDNELDKLSVNAIHSP